MDDFKETAWDHVSGEKYATFSTSEKKWMRAIEDLKEKYPSDVDIRYRGDETIVVRLPASWFKLRPKKQSSMTEEQKEAARKRLEAARSKRFEKIQDDRAVSG